MSESESDNLPLPEGDEEPYVDNGEESISTENDTEADIQELSSIVDEEAPIPERETEVKKSSLEPDQTIVPLDPPKPTEPLKPVEPEKELPPKPKTPEKPKVEVVEPSKATEETILPSEDNIPERDVKVEEKDDPSQKGSSNKTCNSKSSGEEIKSHASVSQKSVPDADGSDLKNGNSDDEKTIVDVSNKHKTAKSKTSTYSEKKSPNIKTKSSKQHSGTCNAPTPEKNRSKSKTSKSPRSSCNDILKVPSQPYQRSSSCTSFAKAETTPSFAQPDSNLVLAGGQSDDVITATSGLQSIRDILFDENDSHKNYLKPIASGNSFHSHQYIPRSREMSRISNPSFNSHVEMKPISMPDVDEATYNKNLETSNSNPKSETLSSSSSDVLSVNNKSGKVRTPSPTTNTFRKDVGSSPELLPEGGKKVEFKMGSNTTTLTLHDEDMAAVEELRQGDEASLEEECSSVSSEDIARYF